MEAAPFHPGRERFLKTNKKSRLSPRGVPRAVRHLTPRSAWHRGTRTRCWRARRRPSGSAPSPEALVQRREGGTMGPPNPKHRPAPKPQTAAWAVDINTRDTRNAGFRYHGVNHGIPEQRRDQASPSSLSWPRLTVIGAVLRIDEDAVAHGHKVRHAQRLAVGEHLPKRVPCGQIDASACLRQAIPSRRSSPPASTRRSCPLCCRAASRQPRMPRGAAA